MIVKNKYTQRLFNEWKEHGNIIIGLDFDDTIFPYREDFTNHISVINLIKEAIITGAKVIIYTGSAPERYPEVIAYCNKVGIKLSGINENIIVPFGDNRKVYANIYIDDRSGLNEAMTILESALYQYRAYLQELKNYDEVA